MTIITESSQGILVEDGYCAGGVTSAGQARVSKPKEYGHPVENLLAVAVTHPGLSIFLGILSYAETLLQVGVGTILGEARQLITALAGGLPLIRILWRLYVHDRGPNGCDGHLLIFPLDLLTGKILPLYCRDRTSVAITEKLPRLLDLEANRANPWDHWRINPMPTVREVLAGEARAWFVETTTLLIDGLRFGTYHTREDVVQGYKDAGAEILAVNCHDIMVSHNGHAYEIRGGIVSQRFPHEHSNLWDHRRFNPMPSVRTFLAVQEQKWFGETTKLLIDGLRSGTYRTRAGAVQGYKDAGVEILGAYYHHVNIRHDGHEYEIKGGIVSQRFPHARASGKAEADPGRSQADIDREIGELREELSALSVQRAATFARFSRVRGVAEAGGFSPRVVAYLKATPRALEELARRLCKETARHVLGVEQGVGDRSKPLAKHPDHGDGHTLDDGRGRAVHAPREDVRGPEDVDIESFSRAGKFPARSHDSGARVDEAATGHGGAPAKAPSIPIRNDSTCRSTKWMPTGIDRGISPGFTVNRDGREPEQKASPHLAIFENTEKYHERLESDWIGEQEALIETAERVAKDIAIRIRRARKLRLAHKLFGIGDLQDASADYGIGGNSQGTSRTVPEALSGLVSGLAELTATRSRCAREIEVGLAPRVPVVVRNAPIGRPRGMEVGL